MQPSIGSAVVYALAWSIATDENIFTYAQQNANDVYNGYIDFHAYMTRPDYNYAYFGDTTDNKQNIQLFTRPLIDMLTLGTGSMLGQAFSDEIKANTPAAYDLTPGRTRSQQRALLRRICKDSAATPRSTTPHVALDEQGRGRRRDHAIRGGARPTRSSYVVMRRLLPGAHQHDETGEFRIFKNAELTGLDRLLRQLRKPTTGTTTIRSTRRCTRTPSRSYQPGEFFPTLHTIQNGASANVNDGGQRPMRRDTERDARVRTPTCPRTLGHKITTPPFVEGRATSRRSSRRAATRTSRAT